MAFLISADLFVCGVVTVIQSFGASKWFGIRMPVMMGLTFASVGPMVAIATSNPGMEGVRMLFGSIIGAGIVAMLIAPQLVDPAHADWLAQLRGGGGAFDVPAVPDGIRLDNPACATPENMGISALVLVTIVAIMKFARGFVANISVLLGIVVWAIAATILGLMQFSYVADAAWFALVTPLRFGLPIFDPVMILTMTLVMIVVMMESTGMFLALGDICGRKIDRHSLSAAPRPPASRRRRRPRRGQDRGPLAHPAPRLARS